MLKSKMLTVRIKTVRIKMVRTAKTAKTVIKMAKTVRMVMTDRMPLVRGQTAKA